jgi:hypothetical protein
MWGKMSTILFETGWNFSGCHFAQEKIEMDYDKVVIDQGFGCGEHILRKNDGARKK